MIQVLIILTLSPVRGPGPRATRIDAIGASWGQRAKVVVLIDKENEDFVATKKACAAHGLLAWELPSAKERKFSQAKAMAYALERAAPLKAQWIFWGNDHTFVIVERLKAYLAALDHRESIYLGTRLYGPCCGVFNSGAAGFALSGPAATLLIENWRDPTSAACDLNNKRNHLAACLKLLNVHPLDTRDHQGIDRFHVYGPVRLATESIDDWFITKKRRVLEASSGFDKQKNHLFKSNFSRVSSSLISFHYVSGQEARLLDSLVHEAHPDISPPYAASQQKLATLWPQSPHLGGYSQPFPSRNKPKAHLVAALLDSIRLTRDEVSDRLLPGG